MKQQEYETRRDERKLIYLGYQTTSLFSLHGLINVKGRSLRPFVTDWISSPIGRLRLPYSGTSLTFHFILFTFRFVYYRRYYYSRHSLHVYMFRRDLAITQYYFQYLFITHLKLQINLFYKRYTLVQFFQFHVHCSFL